LARKTKSSHFSFYNSK